MKLARLEIRRLPGIDVPFTLAEAELGVGLNVIHGPNGIGKSSVVRAVRAVLWPELVPSEGLEIEAQFRSGPVRWHVRREGSRVQWTRDGAASGPPPLPSSDLARSFLIGIEDLSRAEAVDFEREIRREMTGGTDFDALAAECAWSGKRAATLRRELDEARRRTEEVRTEQDGLQNDVERLDELEQQREDAGRQATDLPIAKALVELRVARAALDELQQQLSTLPAGMERLRGDEPRRLEELRERRTRAMQAVDGVRRRETALREELARLDLATLPREEELHELESARERWSRDEAAVAEARRRLQSREAACETARASCPGELPEHVLARADALASIGLDKFLRESQALDAEVKALEAELRLVPSGAPAPESDKFPAALVALRSWLNAPEPAEIEEPRRADGLLPLALLALAVIVLGALVHPAFFAALAIVGFLAWRLAWRLRPAAAPRLAAPSRAAFEAQYESLGLGRLEWTRANVEARYVELEERQRQAGELRAASQRRAELSRKLDPLHQREAELDQRRAALRQSLGLDLEVGDFDLAAFASAVTSFRKAVDERAGAEAELRAALDSESQRADAFRTKFARFSKQAVSDALAATRALSGLATRTTRAADAQRELARAGEERARSEADVARAQQELAAVWSALGLEPDDERGLHERIERLDEWKKLRTELEVKRREVEARERDLGTRAEDAAAPEAELRQRLEAAQQARERQLQLHGEVAALHERLDIARNDRKLESAHAAEARRRLDLERELAVARGKALATLLIEEIRKEFERESQPKVLLRADASLRSFTNGRYGLRGLADGQLRADDAATGRPLTFSQLSTGTRAQLLIALHFAFATEVPAGEKPPHFLDDSLATTDPMRMRAIGAALQAAAKSDDLQCFYLTREVTDVALLAGENPAALRSIDLAALRGLQAPSLTRGELALPPRVVIPDPQGLDAESFGELLRVPRIDGLAAVDAAHLFYVMRDDLPDLKRLLELRIERVGVLRQNLASGAVVLERSTAERTEAWTRFTEAVLDTWRIGRGRPLDREVLASKEIGLSESALEGVESLARELGWDAKQLVERLKKHKIGKQVLREPIRERLSECLEREEYLDPAPVLDKEQAWGRVLGLVANGLQPADSGLRARFDWLWNLLEPKS